MLQAMVKMLVIGGCQRGVYRMHQSQEYPTRSEAVVLASLSDSFHGPDQDYKIQPISLELM